MNKTDMFAIIAIIAAGLGYFMFRIAWPKRSGDIPGPHNNWRKDMKADGDSSLMKMAPA